MQYRALATTVLIASATTTAVLAQQTTVSVAALPPVVVVTVPQAGDIAVDPALAEIRVTFSKEMTDKSWSFVRLTPGSFPELAGEPHYLADKRTCVLPVRLRPGHAYAIYINKDTYTAFRDASGQPAMSYLLAFQTRP